MAKIWEYRILLNIICYSIVGCFTVGNCSQNSSPTGEDVKNEIATPAPEPVSSKPKNAFNWGKTDVVEYIRSLGFPKQAAVFEEQVGTLTFCCCTSAQTAANEEDFCLSTRQEDLIMPGPNETYYKRIVWGLNWTWSVIHTKSTTKSIVQSKLY